MEEGFQFLVRDAGFTSETILQYLDISKSTYRRYLDDPKKIAVLAIQHQAGIAPGWEGFKIRDGYIITPLGDKVHRNQVETYHHAAYINRQIGWHSKNRPLNDVDRDKVVVSLGDVSKARLAVSLGGDF